MPAFPLIQLPKKFLAITDVAAASANSFPLIQLPKKFLDLNAQNPYNATFQVSINSTSEEVFGNYSPGVTVVAEFPLIQLPKKFLVVRTVIKLRGTLVSINSTSEEVFGILGIQPGTRSQGCFH